MVGTFHSHTHNCLCQLDWHPMYITGVGHMEDEGCKHLFSALNELARSTRHATRFHHHQAIKEFFSFWNEDKYEALTHFICNHFRQAMALVHKLMAKLTLLKDRLHLSDDDFPRFLAEERSYLLSVKRVPPQDGVKIRYVQSLDELAEWNAAHEVAIGALNSFIQGDQNTIASVLNAAHIHIDLAYTRLQNTEALVAHFQQLLDLESAWEVGGDEYNQYKKEATLGKYHEALGELEQLVIMRLFELVKLSLSGTGQ
ncbi:hypothetical protein L210DRAFT_3384131 [Boletus edulis BED1]|uniref:Uncharacterized protein n=1 Tax=Boletus edulis BED1 TaxID=1328754 RepID=A0AAD4GLU1_BOLED|nr:hypothetical protein L210DRAFT_3384131 [Boletus edulis BED1]